MIQQPSLNRYPLAETWSQPAATGGARPGDAPGFRASAMRFGRWVKRASVQPLVKLLRRRVIRAVSPIKAPLLEVGVGAGSGLSGYDTQIQVVGTEQDPSALRAARARVAQGAMDNVAGLHRCPPSSLTFADASFQTVMAFFVFTRNAQPARIVRELIRVTRPGGRIVVVNRYSGRGRRTADQLAPRTPRLLLTRQDIELIRERAFGPFGLFTVSEFAKRPA